MKKTTITLASLFLVMLLLNTTVSCDQENEIHPHGKTFARRITRSSGDVPFSTNDIWLAENNIPNFWDDLISPCIRLRVNYELSNAEIYPNNKCEIGGHAVVFPDCPEMIIVNHDTLV